LSDTETREKLDLRERMKALRQSLSPGEVLSASEKVKKRLLAQPLVEMSRTVCVYASTGKEIRTGELMEELLAAGKKVCVPDWEGWRSGSGMRLIRINQVAELLTEGRIVPQPGTIEGRIVLTEEVDLFLVPGLAFDERGNRLGMGGGYFDRLLSGASPKASLIGLAHDFQVLPEIPREAHDIPMTAVIGPSAGGTGQVNHIQEGTTQ
jgi:5-formyltetrahydrofolate cyclo-ligase